MMQQKTDLAMQIKDLITAQAEAHGFGATAAPGPLRLNAAERLQQYNISSRRHFWTRLAMRDVLNTPVLPIAQSSNSVDIASYQKKPSAIPVIFRGGCCVSPQPKTNSGVEVDVLPIDTSSEQQHWSTFMANAACEITPALAVMCGQSVVNIRINAPVQIELIYITDKAPSTDGYHINIDVAAGVRASIDQYIYSTESAEGSACIVSRTIKLDKDADLVDQFVGKIPEISFMQCQQVSGNERSTYRAYQALTGGKVCRQVSELILNEPQASAAVYGVGLANEKQRHDHTILVRHQASHTQSTQQVKYCVDQQALSNFTSRVYVASGVYDIESDQLNHNLLLSNQARALTAPELEIYADDVRCAHGATVGALDEQAVFYLQSRGLNLQQARATLVSGFMKDLIEVFPTAACDRAQSLVDHMLAQTEGCQQD